MQLKVEIQFRNKPLRIKTLELGMGGLLQVLNWLKERIMGPMRKNTA